MSDNNQRTFDFATIGFRPYPETEEFVTIGVVALDIESQEFGYSLLDARRTARINPMFPMAKRLYQDVRQRLESELASIEDALHGANKGLSVPMFPTIRDEKSGLFSAITHPREGAVCYPIKGRRKAEHMSQVLEALYKRFVERHLAAPAQAAEAEMSRHLKEVLKGAKLLPAYKTDARIGTKSYQVPFAFAHMIGENTADKAIKPLNFDLTKPTEIYNHGDVWLTRLRRLERYDRRPELVLFTMRPPREESILCDKAFEEIRGEFEADGILVPVEGDDKTVIDFARLPEPPNLRLA